MIIHEITLTKPRNKRIVALAEQAGYTCENKFIQDLINELADCREMPNLLGDLLAKELSDEKRLSHKEK